MDKNALDEEFEKFHFLKWLNEGRLTRLSSLLVIYKLAGVQIPLRLAVAIKRLENKQAFLENKLVEIDNLKARASNLDHFGSESLVEETNRLRRSLEKIMYELEKESFAMEELEETIDLGLDLEEVLHDIVKDDSGFSDIKSFIDDMSLDIQPRSEVRREEEIGEKAFKSPEEIGVELAIEPNLVMEREQIVSQETHLDIEKTETPPPPVPMDSTDFIVPGFESYPFLPKVELKVDYLPHVNNTLHEATKVKATARIDQGIEILNHGAEITDFEAFLRKSIETAISTL